MGNLLHETYAYAARRRDVSVEELRQWSELPAAEIDKVVEKLLELHLLTPRAGTVDRLVAVSPAMASAKALLPALRELQTKQREIGEMSALLTELTLMYEPLTSAGIAAESLQSIPDLAVVRQVITELSTRCQGEVLTSQPGGARPEPVLDEATERTVAMLKRGVVMRTLYHHAAQFSRPTVRHVDMLTSLGAEVRTLSDAFTRLLVFDREVAVIDLRGRRIGALLVRDPSVIDFLVMSFERAWAQATPFPVSYSRDHVVAVSDDLKRTLLRLFVEGHEDKVIAKRLGISLRTYQRHLSEIMKRIGARNRPHAGYLVHKLRLLERDS